jgi:hypothetical protein
MNLYAQTGVQQSVRADGRGDILRGQPRRGSGASGGAVATGNGINWNGGPVLRTVNLYYIWYGNWGQDPNASAILTNFANHIGGSPYFNINTTYGDSSGNVLNAVTFKGAYTDAGSQGTSLTDGSIFTIVSKAIASGSLGPADPNGVYEVLTAPGVNETSGFLTSYCGWHTAAGYNGTTIQYAFIGDAAGPSLGNCAAQTSSSPNNDPGADAMASVMAHELEEAVSDPHLNAWYDSSGNENADKCAWTFGTTYISGNGVANMTLGSMNYLIQQNWVNAGGGYCALSYAASPDFTVGTSNSQTVLQGGTTGNYTLTATSQTGFDVSTVTWSFGSMPGGITYTPTSSLTGGTATFTLTASASAAGGTYAIPITGTSGTLHHSLNASLVVTAPGFSVAVSGAQSVLPGGTSAKYTLTDTPLNGFNGIVTWTFGALPAGITVNAANPLQGSPATFTLTVASSVTPTTYAIPITGTSGTVQHSLTATLTVSAPTFSLTITPSSQTVSRPSSGTMTVTYAVNVNSMGGFAGPVTLAASGGTTGISPSITGTNAVTAGGIGTLSVTITNSAKKGNRSLTVTGTAGTTVNSATATIQVH